jgi:hypothetical protein
MVSMQRPSALEHGLAAALSTLLEKDADLGDSPTGNGETRLPQNPESRGDGR